MTTTTSTKRHRWPKRPPGACRNGDKCLDCGTYLNDAKRGGHPCTPRQVESPDGRELTRAWCPEGCGYSIASAIWCSQPCCDQSPEGFIDGLLAAEAARGIPVFAVRFLDPLPSSYSPDVRVRIWRAGNLTPVFTGPIPCAMQFQMDHDCPHPKE